MGKGWREIWTGLAAGIFTSMAIILGIEAVLILARLVYLLWVAKP